MARLPGSEALLCINFYAPSATSTNQSKFIRAWLVIVTGGLSELAREHCLAHVLAEITPHRYPPIEGILCIIQVIHTSLLRPAGNPGLCLVTDNLHHFKR